MHRVHLGFVGAGNMAEAIARGILAGGVLGPREMVASDPDPERRLLFRDKLGIVAVETNEPVVQQAPVVLVAVKPQTFDKAITPLGGLMGPSKLVLSICAGLSTGHIEEVVAAGTRVVRAMPNTPIVVGRGLVALAAGSKATEDDLTAAERLLGAAAEIVRVPEHLMDAVTAVSGSGPAYFYYLVELLGRAGTAAGLPAEQAAHLAQVTFEGAAKLLAESNETPAVLRAKGTSPGGTTEAAIDRFEALGLAKTLLGGVLAARDRSRELGR